MLVIRCIPLDILPTTLSLHKTESVAAAKQLVSNESEVKTSGHSEPGYQTLVRLSVSGKAYQRLRAFLIVFVDCVQADRRLTSIRQQSDLQKSTVGERTRLCLLHSFVENVSSAV